MPDDGTTTTTTPPTTTTEPTKAPEIPMEVLDGIQKQAIEKAVAEAQKAGKDTADKIISDHKRQIAASLGLGGDDNSSEKVLEKLLGNPVEVLTRTAQTAVAQAEKNISDKLERERAADREAFAKQQELREALIGSLKDRPDIRNDEEAREAIDAFYLQADSKLSEKEKVAFAVKKFDLLLEKKGAGKAEDRIKAAASISSASGIPTPPKQKDESEYLREYQDKRIERYKKTHGGRIPR